MVIKELRASLKLLIASRVMAIECDNKPTTALNIANTILTSMPMKLVLIIFFSLFSIFPPS
jgi:hypothetical protein